MKTGTLLFLSFVLLTSTRSSAGPEINCWRTSSGISAEANLPERFCAIDFRVNLLPFRLTSEITIQTDLSNGILADPGRLQLIQTVPTGYLTRAIFERTLSSPESCGSTMVERLSFDMEIGKDGKIIRVGTPIGEREERVDSCHSIPTRIVLSYERE